MQSSKDEQEGEIREEGGGVSKVLDRNTRAIQHQKKDGKKDKDGHINQKKKQKKQKRITRTHRCIYSGRFQQNRVLNCSVP